MDESSRTEPTSAALAEAVFHHFKLHNSSTRLCTELVMLERIRVTHPNHLVTRTTKPTCDLIGYANAGHALITKTSEDEIFDGSRAYKPAASRLSGNPGELHDDVNFAQYTYHWNGIEFIIYQVETREPFIGDKQLFYILSPRSLVREGSPSPNDGLLMAVGAWSAELHDEIYVFDDGYWDKNKELWKSVNGSSWDEVILNPDMKSNLISDVQGFFDNRALYQKLAVPWKRGIIFHGVPGNGKTISIKALIATLNTREHPVPSLYVKSFEGCNGEKFSIHLIFTKARAMAPCLLIFEDLDSLVTDETRSYFLNEVDGLEANDGILMIGSTNHLGSLDPAISKRPSRFDRKYHFKIPDVEERTSYAKYWRRKLEGSEMVEFPVELCGVIAKLSEGFSFAYLKELFVIALLTIVRGVDVQEGEEVKISIAEPSVTVDRASPSPSVSQDEKDASDTPVLVEHETTNLEISSNTDPTLTFNSEDIKVKPQLKRTLPEVEIPESLQSNILLKVIRGQMSTLLEEMDSTKENDWPSDRKKKLSSATPRVQMASFARQISRAQ